MVRASFLLTFLPKDGGVLSDDGLDARLIVHVHDELFTACDSHHIHHGLYPASHLKKFCIQRRCIHRSFIISCEGRLGFYTYNVVGWVRAGIETRCVR
jgi:hypothetical protein